MQRLTEQRDALTRTIAELDPEARAAPDYGRPR
jgi:hypothetical protein